MIIFCQNYLHFIVDLIQYVGTTG